MTCFVWQREWGFERDCKEANVSQRRAGKRSFLDAAHWPSWGSCEDVEMRQVRTLTFTNDGPAASIW